MAVRTRSAALRTTKDLLMPLHRLKVVEASLRHVTVVAEFLNVDEKVHVASHRAKLESKGVS
jgi:hypothetical protein